MKNKNVLRRMSVLAVALVCAVWGLARCSSPNSSFGGGKTSSSLSTLESLQLAYESSEENLLADFDPLTESYTVDIAANNGGKTIVVTASAKNGTSVEISVDGVPAADGKTAAPKAGTADVIISIAVGGTSGRHYSITLSAPQNSDDNDYSIKSLFAGYTEDGTNLIANLSGTSWSINTARDQSRAVVKVEAMSMLSPIEIRVGGQKVAEGTGSASAASIALGGQAVSIDIKIFKKAGYQDGVGESKLYTVTFNPPAAELATWTGTAEYTGSLGYTVVAVVANNNTDAAQNADLGAYLPEPRTGREWKLEIDTSYRPGFFTATLEKKVANGADYISEYKQSKAFELDAAQLTSKSGINLVIADEDTGIYINNANDFVKYLSTTDKNANYALGGDIDLADYYDEDTKLQVSWNGPVGYAGKFFGNGYTIHNLIIDPTKATTNYNSHATIALFNAIQTGAYLENFTVEVTSINQDKGGKNITLYFGGVVGEVAKTSGWTTASPPAIIKGVTVTGELKLLNWQSHTNIGGIVGVVQDGNLVLENCVTNIEIGLTDGQYSNGNFNSFGGLIGTTGGTVTIRNSYARGDLKIKNVGDRNIRVGGLVGAVWPNNTTGNHLTIEHSYATGTVIADEGNRSAWSSDRAVGAGGLVGIVLKNVSLTITNSIALNPVVLALTESDSPETIITASGVARVSYGRLVGATYEGGTLATTNNRARSDMLTGYVKPGAVEVLAGDNEIARSYSDFKTKTPWLELGFNESVWNFSRISEGKGPTLR